MRKARFLLDTSCMVALVCLWHVHHGVAAREVQRRLKAGDGLVVAGPTLIEAFAVLTRLPPPHRMAAADCLALLEENFLSPAIEVVALGAPAYRALLQAAARRGTTGGSIYDAVVHACAVQADADAILTFNGRHFAPFADSKVQIVTPS